MVSLWKIFWIFAKIGAFTIGGGIPMIAAIKKEAGGKWALFMVLYSCSMAWLAAFVVKLISGLL